MITSPLCKSTHFYRITSILFFKKFIKFPFFHPLLFLSILSKYRLSEKKIIPRTLLKIPDFPAHYIGRLFL